MENLLKQSSLLFTGEIPVMKYGEGLDYAMLALDSENLKNSLTQLDWLLARLVFLLV